MRVGFGFDSHLFDVKGTLTLGGISVSGCPSLIGHSDGDALVHAVIDALLGAACLGDIGEIFPDSDKRIKGISSLKMLDTVLKRLRNKGFIPAHIDITVVADRPRLSMLKSKIKKKLSKAIKIPTSVINIKAKTPEGLMWFRDPGGVAVWAIASVNFLKDVGH